jgi:hypothetical protein
MVSAHQMEHFVANWDKARNKGPLRLILVKGSVFAAIFYVILSSLELKILGFQEAFFGREGLKNIATGAVIGYLNAGYYFWSQERTWRRYQKVLRSNKEENRS